MSYLSEWSLVQSYEGDAEVIRAQIENLEMRYTRLMDMAAQHRHLMQLLLDVAAPPEAV